MKILENKFSEQCLAVKSLGDKSILEQVVVELEKIQHSLQNHKKKQTPGQRGSQNQQLRIEINNQLKEIIDYFEVGKDSNIKISKDIDESSLQYVKMIVDVVMPFKSNEESQPRQKKKHEKAMLKVTKNIASIDQINEESEIEEEKFKQLNTEENLSQEDKRVYDFDDEEQEELQD